MTNWNDITLLAAESCSSSLAKLSAGHLVLPHSRSRQVRSCRRWPVHVSFSMTLCTLAPVLTSRQLGVCPAPGL
jgi:hypothetical protein